MRSRALSSLLEPIIIVFLGVVIGGLVVAMYLPIFKLGQVVGFPKPRTRRRACRRDAFATLRCASNARMRREFRPVESFLVIASPCPLPCITMLIFVALVGLCVGSFLNVVIHRLPRMLERGWRAQCAELSGEDSAPQARPTTSRASIAMSGVRPPHRCDRKYSGRQLSRVARTLPRLQCTDLGALSYGRDARRPR